MSTPNQPDALSPKDLQYYVPRKLRDGIAASPSITPSPRANEPQAAQDDWTAAITPLPTAFRTALDDLNKHDTDMRPTGSGRKAKLMLAAAASVIGIAVGIGLVEFVQRDAGPVSLATRLQTATADLQKVTTQGPMPALAAAARGAETNPQPPVAETTSVAPTITMEARAEESQPALAPAPVSVPAMPAAAPVAPTVVVP